MRISSIWTLLAATCSVSAQAVPRRDYQTYDYYAVHLDPSIHPSKLSTHLGIEYDGKLGELEDHHIFRSLRQDRDVVEDAVEDLRRRRRKRDAAWEPSVLDGILLNRKQKLEKRLWKRSPDYWDEPEIVGRAVPTVAVDSNVIRQQELMQTLNIKDPIFNEQWHLFNTHDPGNDLNVTGVWLQGITGKNATVCIVDDGLDMDSDDLKPNYFAGGSYDFNDHVDEPKPRLDDDHHGTRCAGEVAAAKNNACGVGVAWDSRISGIRILSGGLSEADEAHSLNYGFQENDIYSCSWGPPDDGRSMEAPSILVKRAIVTGVQKGRQGNGTIYVFAAGNGAMKEDNCNFDGYTNSIYSITVGAITRKNQHPYYSEACSAQLVVTYSSDGSGNAIHTTDVGAHTRPLAAGVYALVLEIRPDLTWRDMQWLTVLHAEYFDDAPSDWQETATGRKYSHQFGYGKLNAWAIIEAAKTWKSGDKGIASTFEVTPPALQDANLARIEHITVTMNVEHTRRGDLSVELRSPSGVVSHLSTTRKSDDERAGYVDWTFMSVAHWNESGIGNWTIIVKDTIVNEHNGSFTDWRLRLWGESIDGSKAKLLPLPSEHDDDDHDDIVSAPAHTTTVAVPSGATPTGDLPANPSDHPDRPVKPGPVDGTTKPTLTPTATVPFEAPSATSTGTPEENNSSFLPSPFPTFGLSKRTQIWIYGSLALILVFCASLAVYLFLARRKRLRLAGRDDYEFEVLEDEDEGRGAGAGVGVGTGVGGGRQGRRKRRAGELYDAFAGESDEELLSEDEDEGEGEV
ncbi:pheromone processing endoprotease [Coniosporium tulheliwenetii]|uniref:Pheromone processing endoprotease n=1 Tax=Coniosporium tulheliwenetii TaxID=3383036 RepID=A0ACC2ZM80_9PEZI|nr:pheromone processing endoprotease [Cladosporium sp. JES 115]